MIIVCSPISHNLILIIKPFLHTNKIVFVSVSINFNSFNGNNSRYFGWLLSGYSYNFPTILFLVLPYFPRYFNAVSSMSTKLTGVDFGAYTPKVIVTFNFDVDLVYSSFT